MVDENAIVEDLFSQMSEEVVAEAAAYPKDELILLHHSLGRFIRNEYLLWEYTWTPQIEDGVDVSPDHPDAISMRCIEKLHEKCIAAYNQSPM